MPAASNVPWDVAMSRPSPLSAPVYSPTTAPMSAKPKAECSDARIQEVALGTTIVVSTPNRLAPRMRALLTRLRSTSRAPWKALKNTAKKTSTTAVATFEDRPRPNQITNSDARTMRGTALAALMNGAATSARKRARPSRMPSTTPAIAPSTNPPTASSSVTAIWAQIEPAVSTVLAAALDSVSTGLCSTAGILQGLGAGSGDLVAQALPHLAVRVEELGGKPDLLDIARPLQRHREGRLDRCGARGHDHHPVGERDRFLQVVRDEDDGGTGTGPQPQQLVLHEAARLHIEGAEWLVHQHDLRLVLQGLCQRDPLAHAAGELMRVVRLEAGEPDPLDPGARRGPGGRP